jgi:hypothetical protein
MSEDSKANSDAWKRIQDNANKEIIALFDQMETGIHKELDTARAWEDSMPNKKAIIDRLLELKSEAKLVSDRFKSKEEHSFSELDEMEEHILLVNKKFLRVMEFYP